MGFPTRVEGGRVHASWCLLETHVTGSRSRCHHGEPGSLGGRACPRPQDEGPAVEDAAPHALLPLRRAWDSSSSRLKPPATFVLACKHGFLCGAVTCLDLSPAAGGSWIFPAPAPSLPPPGGPPEPRSLCGCVPTVPHVPARVTAAADRLYENRRSLNNQN